MQKSKRCYALGEKEIDKYTRSELRELLKILDESGIDITEYFLSEEHMIAFQNAPDSEKLRQIKQILISKYNQDIRKEIAMKLAKQIEKENMNPHFLLDGVLKELDKLLTSICYCLLREDNSIETFLAEETPDYNFFEKILRLFKAEHSKDLEKIRKQEIYKSLDVKTPEKNSKAKYSSKNKELSLD